MSWVVETCIVIDVLENDPPFGIADSPEARLHSARGAAKQVAA